MAAVNTTREHFTAAPGNTSKSARDHVRDSVVELSAQLAVHHHRTDVPTTAAAHIDRAINDMVGSMLGTASDDPQVTQYRRELEPEVTATVAGWLWQSATEADAFHANAGMLAQVRQRIVDANTEWGWGDRDVTPRQAMNTALRVAAHHVPLADLYRASMPYCEPHQTMESFCGVAGSTRHDHSSRQPDVPDAQHQEVCACQVKGCDGFEAHTGEDGRVLLDECACPCQHLHEAIMI